MILCLRFPFCVVRVILCVMVIVRSLRMGDRRVLMTVMVTLRLLGLMVLSISLVRVLFLFVM